jgi:hypothetical protein
MTKLDLNGKNFSSPMQTSNVFFFQTEPLSVIGCLRLLTALEELLGSLGPQINAMLSRFQVL